MITGITHLAFAVTDLEKTLDFYCGKLGFEKLFTLNNDKGELWIQYVKVAHGQYLEFFPVEKVAERNGQSYQHLCLESDDLNATVGDLRSRGVTIASEVNQGADGALQAWIHDPDGNPIELMELRPSCRQRTLDQK